MSFALSGIGRRANDQQAAGISDMDVGQIQHGHGQGCLYDRTAVH
jgi:hypothetical protein